MAVNRARELMEAATKELLEGYSPFSDWFNKQYNVFADEQESLMSSMAAGLGMIMMFADAEEAGEEIVPKPAGEMIFMDL